MQPLLSSPLHNGYLLLWCYLWPHKITADCKKSCNTHKRSSGKPQLIYHIWIWSSFLPKHALPLCSGTINQLWFSTIQVPCYKTFAISCCLHVLSDFWNSIPECPTTVFTHTVCTQWLHLLLAYLSAWIRDTILLWTSVNLIINC